MVKCLHETYGDGDVNNDLFVLQQATAAPSTIYGRYPLSMLILVVLRDDTVFSVEATYVVVALLYAFIVG